MIKNLNDFGISGKNIEVPRFKLKDEVQFCISDFTDTVFVCPISKLEYMNKYRHNLLCKYKYCKSGWKW